MHTTYPATARLAQSAERKALNLVIVGSNHALYTGSLLRSHGGRVFRARAFGPDRDCICIAKSKRTDSPKIGPKLTKQTCKNTRSRQPELMQIIMRAGSDGMTLALAGRTMAAKDGFTRSLREQRMNFRQFVDLNADTFRTLIRGNASKILVTPEAAARTRQRPDGTLMQFQRLRRT